MTWRRLIQIGPEDTYSPSRKLCNRRGGMPGLQVPHLAAKKSLTARVKPSGRSRLEICPAPASSTNRELGSASLSLRMCCFVNDTATTEIYTLSLHDALPAPRLAAAS